LNPRRFRQICLAFTVVSWLAMAEPNETTYSNVIIDGDGHAKGQIEQGPVWMRLTAFAAGVGSILALIFHLWGFFTSGFAQFILHGYLLLFALTTMLFEAKPEWVEKINGANGYLDMLIKHCGFLCHALGRGLFYIFQGSLWLTYFKGWSGGFSDFLVVGVSFALGFVGFLCILMHFGIMPHHIADKTMHYAGLVVNRGGPDANNP